jgi:hypothetical protein
MEVYPNLRRYLWQQESQKDRIIIISVLRVVRGEKLLVVDNKGK